MRCNRTIVAVLTLVLIFVVAAAVSAVDRESLKVPEPGNRQVLKLSDGSTLYGKITEVTDSEIKFQTDMGEMTVSIMKIESIMEVSETKFKGGKYWFENPNRTRLLLAQNGRNLRKGQGYFADVWVFFPSVAYGLTDNISLAAGATLIPGIDMDQQLWYLTPKIGVAALPTVSLAVSAMIIRVPDTEDNDIEDPAEVVGAIFPTGTFGTDDASITAGLGFGFVDSEIADKPVVLIGGELRVTRRIALVTENWVFPGVDNPLISYGVRFFSETIAVDLAFFTLTGEDAVTPGIPYIDFVVNF